MGTPDFALPSLGALVKSGAAGRIVPAGLDIVGVITRPDKIAGRGRQLLYSPVKQSALDHGLPIHQPGPLRRPEALELVTTLAPDLIVVAAFGQILPPPILQLPPFGCLNVHASLLPRHRGAAPITAAILAGDGETGVTIMLMDEGLDTGPMLAKRSLPIGAEDTAGTLFEKLGQLGADLLLQTLPRWLAGEITPQPQDPAEATVTHVLSKADGLIDWAQPAQQVERAVRAYNPWPSAYTSWNALTLKVHKAHVLTGVLTGGESGPLPPGQCFLLDAEPSASVDSVNSIDSTDSTRGTILGCACGQGALALDVIQLAGKRALATTEVLRGHADLATALLGT
jgi:methionyl-tRNA formyltransferase